MSTKVLNLEVIALRAERLAELVLLGEKADLIILDEEARDLLSRISQHKAIHGVSRHLG